MLLCSYAMKHLLSINDLSREEIIELLKLAQKLKKKKRGFAPLRGKTLGLIMEKPSTRTTVSFAVAMYQLGGLPIILASAELQRKRGETIADTSHTLSRYLDVVALRTFSHKDLSDFADNSRIPVINALSNIEHPCQALGDILTIVEKKSPGINGLKKLKIVFVGDGNNVANSLLLVCSKLSMKLTVVSPAGYEPSGDIMARAREISRTTDAEIKLSNSIDALKSADVLYTDVWASMGKDDEREKRKDIFRRYQLSCELVSKAKKDAIVMHCLPARRGEEITDEVIDGSQSVVFDQAENRLHIQKAILLKLLANSK